MPSRLVEASSFTRSKGSLESVNDPGVLACCSIKRDLVTEVDMRDTLLPDLVGAMVST